MEVFKKVERQFFYLSRFRKLNLINVENGGLYPTLLVNLNLYKKCSVQVHVCSSFQGSFHKLYALDKPILAVFIFCL